jgi:hypothetical protein
MSDGLTAFLAGTFDHDNITKPLASFDLGDLFHG